MAINKKGYFFSLAVVVLLAILFFSFSAQRNPGYSRDAAIATQRLTEIDSFLTSIEQDAPTALSVASYRAFITLHDDVVKEEQRYLNDFDERFFELVTQGTLYGQPTSLLLNESLRTWESHLYTLAHQLRIALTIDNQELSVHQENPWELIVTLNMTLHVQDNYTQSTFEHPITVHTIINITNLYDPVTAIGTNGKMVQRIKKHPTNDATDIEGLLKNHYYIQTITAPSYLQRLKGDLASSPNGIERLVILPDLTQVDVVEEGSIIDWHYFGTNRLDTCIVVGQPSWIRIDQERAADYGATCT